jgi:radical SAM protein with 4Fe4S-binding SPASM domain
MSGASRTAPLVPRPIPLFERLIIESHAFCNRACWFCPRTYDRSGNYLDRDAQPVSHRMETTTIHEILDQAKALGFTGRVGFHHYSEPLLDDRNVDLARAARERGMSPYLHTNGDRLRREPALCRDVERVYEHVVVGLYDYDTAEELEEARREWRERLPSARLDFSPIGRSTARVVPSVVTPRALVPFDKRMAAPDVAFVNGPCHRPLVRMLIKHDGEMANCCEDLTGAFGLGNVHEHSIEALWFSDAHVRIVQDLVAGRRADYALCRSCPQMPTAGLPDGARIVMRPRAAAGAAGHPVGHDARVATP